MERSETARRQGKRGRCGRGAALAAEEVAKIKLAHKLGGLFQRLLGKLDEVFRQTAVRMQAVLTRAQTT